MIFQTIEVVTFFMAFRCVITENDVRRIEKDHYFIKFSVEVEEMTVAYRLSLSSHCCCCCFDAHPIDI